jgi:hypothetical protein
VSCTGPIRHKVYLHELLPLRLTAFPKGSLAPGVTFPEAKMHWSNGSEAGVSRDREGLRLAFTANGDPVHQTLALRHHPRHYGGHMVTMLCPSCCRSVRIVYCWRGRFICRHCTSATYRSKTRDKAHAAQIQYQRIRARVRPGTEDCRLDYFPRRPKGMRRVTYGRLKARAAAKLDRYHEHLDARLFPLLARLAPGELASLLA